jgi:hypothetical protein
MIRVGLGGPDYSSINFLKKWPRGFYISPLVDNFDCNFRDFLIRQYFQDGAALFGRESPTELQDVRDWAQGRLDNASDAAVYQLVQYFVQRVRNYVHLSSLNRAKIKYARVPETCKTCPQIEGKTRLIDVVRSMTLLRHFRTMSHDEYLEMVFAQDNGFPPFSVDCRCQMEGIVI